MGIHNPRFVVWLYELEFAFPTRPFVAWSLELWLRIRNAGSTLINRITVLALHCFLLPRVPIKMQGVVLLDCMVGYSTIVYLRFLFSTLPCPVLTHSCSTPKMFDKCVRGAVGKLHIAGSGTGLQQAFAAMSPNSGTACMGCLKLAVYNAAAPHSLSALPRPHSLSQPYERRQQPNLRPNTPSDEDTRLATLDKQVFHTAKFARTAARTGDGRFLGRPGHNCRYGCAH